MPIREITERVRIPIKGHIRLGVRQETAKGALYPKSVEHFVLKDAPEVEAFYGPDPKELDICFPTTNIEQLIPTWYKYFNSSTKGSNGEIKTGSLVCIGDGPLEGCPGRATWMDRSRLPSDGVLNNGERDPKSGHIYRECWGKDCSDARDARGNTKCKQTMQVYCFLPLVSMSDIYVITTSSWYSIRSFHERLMWDQRANGPEYILGPVLRNNKLTQGNYYKIIREVTETKYKDSVTGAEKKSTQYVMLLKGSSQEMFLNSNMPRLQLVASKMQYGAPMLALPTAEEAIHMPMEDIYPTIEGKVEVPVVLQPSIDEVLLKDPEVLAAFDALAIAKGIKFTDKAKRQSILKKASQPDVKKAVLDEIAMAIASAKPKVSEEIKAVDAEVLTQEAKEASEIAKEYNNKADDFVFDEIDASFTPPPVVKDNALIPGSEEPSA